MLRIERQKLQQNIGLTDKIPTNTNFVIFIKTLEKTEGQSRMENVETWPTLGTRHKTKTSKKKPNSSQNTNLK